MINILASMREEAEEGNILELLVVEEIVLPGSSVPPRLLNMSARVMCALFIFWPSIVYCRDSGWTLLVKQKLL